jgi:outer membrane receptor protein involved in Fe transport
MALALAVATPAQAQSDTSSLQGHVDGAAAGAQVVATDTFTGQKVTGTIDANGDYSIIGLRPSTYKVEVAGKPAQEITVLVGQTSVVDFSDAKTDIVVSGRILREVRTSSIATNVTPAQIENLPQNQRNFMSFAALAPGIQVNSPSGAQQIQAGAISASNVNVLLDGASMKNLTNHGGVFGQNFGLGNPFPQIAIQEYKVETQNFGAETGLAGSALITAVTKTGGDQFHGSAFIQFQPNFLIEQPYFDKLNNRPKPRYNRKQFGGDLGGPIIPGKLTFYLAGEGTIQNLPGGTSNVRASNPAGLGYPSSVISAINGVPHSFDFKQGLYFGKLTYYASDKDTVNLSAFIRRENNLSDIDDHAAPTHGRTILTHQDRYQLQWKHNGDDWFNVLNITYDKASQSTPSVGTGPEFVLSQGAAADFTEGALFGAHFFTQGDGQKQIGIKNDTTLRKGDHTIKFGFQLGFFDLSRSVSNRFNGSYYFANPGSAGSFDPATATPYGFRINTQATSTVAAKDTQIGLYIQDEWKPDDHWTLNYGVRWDFESNANNNNYVTPAHIVTALSTYRGWQARGIDYRDYVSTGSNRKPQWTQFAPRVGFAYDVKGDRDLVIFGGAGRYYDRSLFIAGVIETLVNSENIVQGTFCTAPGVPAGCTVNWSPAMRDPDVLRAAAAAGGNRGSVWVLNNKTKAPYSDQFDLGIRKRLGDVQLTVTLSHIRSHNIFQFVRANFHDNGFFTVNADCSDGGDAWINDNAMTAAPPGCPGVGPAILPGFSGRLNRGMNDGKAAYTGLYVQLEKPFTNTSDLGFSSTLTIQRARTNDAMELNNDEFFNGARQDAYGWGYVNGVEDWRWVSTVNYRAPWGIILSGTSTFTSGPRFGNIQAAWNTSPSISTPLDTTVWANFGGPLRPKSFIGYKRIDLRVAKTFDFGGGHELTFDFQAFNVFNWLNRNYSSWGSGQGNNPPRTEDSQIARDARSFQAGIKYKF